MEAEHERLRRVHVVRAGQVDGVRARDVAACEIEVLREAGEDVARVAACGARYGCNAGCKRHRCETPCGTREAVHNSESGGPTVLG